MNKTALAFFTKDKVDLSKRTIEPLLQPDKFDLWWFDGSDTEEAKQFAVDASADGIATCCLGVRGGPDAAVVNALTNLLDTTFQTYDFIGLCENDVLLDPDWFDPTFALFKRGRQDGLEVGAVSARCYEDRVLIQRDGYAICHNLGWGMVIMTRQAAQLALQNMRTGFTTELRRTFCQLSGIDVGTYWAFKTNEHWTSADWSNDRLLASRGLASLALTPSPVEMIGQDPPLEEQGLKIVKNPWVKLDQVDAALRFADNTAAIRYGDLKLPGNGPRFQADDGGEVVFAHHLAGVPHLRRQGDWRHKWTQGLGCFSWQGAKDAAVEFEATGACKLMLSGGKTESQVAVEDMRSGYIMRPTFMPGSPVMNALVPAGVSTRMVRLTVLRGDPIFYGVAFTNPQPSVPYTFDHSALPPI